MGAVPRPDGGTEFRVWAPKAKESVAIRLAAGSGGAGAGEGVVVAAGAPAFATMRADGFDVAVANAGVSGDTASGGLERVDWSVPDGTDLVIVELGANDMLRGIDPDLTRTALDGILARLKQRDIKAMLAGMYAAPNLGADYAGRFAAIYPGLAKRYGVPLYPFFLAGIIGKPDLHLADGLHPNREGVAVIVKSILPDVEAALRGLRPPG